MDRILTWFIDNRIAANLMMVLILVGGVISMGGIKREIFPELDAEFVSVKVIYPGASPEEVEEGICIKIEEEIQSLEGIKELRSRAFESVGIVNVEVKSNYDSRTLLDDIKAKVDAITTFPEDAEKPIIEELTGKQQVISLAVYADGDSKELRELSSDIRDELLDLPEISKVEFANARPFEISIEVSESTLRNYNLSFDDIASAIRSSSVNLPAGALKGAKQQILVRTLSQSYTGEDFEKIVIRRGPGGNNLYLRDIATVRDGLADTDQISRFDGKPAILLHVFRIGEEGALEVAGAVKHYVEEKNKQLPRGIRVAGWQDSSLYLRGRMELLQRNGLIGIIFVFITLALFLRPALAFWVTLGIPISFLGAFLVMPYLGVTINLLSLFGFILVLGIVVDDAIIVGESIYSRIEAGDSFRDAAVTGVKRVFVSVTFSVMTTIAAFYALISVPGNMGTIFAVISYIVIACLVFSLIESLTILPVHLAHDWIEGALSRFSGIMGKWDRLQDRFNSAFKRFRREWYQPVLVKVIRARYLTLVVACGIWIISIGAVAGGWVRFSFFPDVEADYVSVGIALPEGSAVEATSSVLKRIEGAVVKLREELKDETGEDMFLHMQTALGGQPFRSKQGHRGGVLDVGISEPHKGEVTLELIPAQVRSVSAPEVERRLREMVGPLPEVQEVAFTSALFSSGDPIRIEITGHDFDVLGDVAAELRAVLSTYPGVYDINDTYRSGKREILLKPTRQAEFLGVGSRTIGAQVRQAVHGEEVQRIQRGHDEIKVMLRYPESGRQEIDDIRRMRIRLKDGRELPIQSLAEIKRGRGFAGINRIDRRRTIEVSAKVDETVTNAQEVIAHLKDNHFGKIQSGNSEIGLAFAGQQKELSETVGGLKAGFAVAMILIYALMAIPFRSYFQPVVIMFAIPFGVVGAIIGHLLIGIPVTILSLFGLVALSGVVVNDGIVLVNFINAKRDDGQELEDAVLDGGRERFRAVVITSLTTFFGLTPMIFEQSTQAQFLVPIAVSLGFGVMFATVITLLLVPATYLIVEDATRILHKGVNRSSWRLRYQNDMTRGVS